MTFFLSQYTFIGVGTDFTVRETRCKYQISKEEKEHTDTALRQY